MSSSLSCPWKSIANIFQTSHAKQLWKQAKIYISILISYIRVLFMIPLNIKYLVDINNNILMSDITLSDSELIIASQYNISETTTIPEPEPETTTPETTTTITPETTTITETTPETTTTIPETTTTIPETTTPETITTIPEITTIPFFIQIVKAFNELLPQSLTDIQLKALKDMLNTTELSQLYEIILMQRSRSIVNDSFNSSLFESQLMKSLRIYCELLGGGFENFYPGFCIKLGIPFKSLPTYNTIPTNELANTIKDLQRRVLNQIKIRDTEALLNRETLTQNEIDNALNANTTNSQNAEAIGVATIASLLNFSKNGLSFPLILSYFQSNYPSLGNSPLLSTVASFENTDKLKLLSQEVSLLPYKFRRLVASFLHIKNNNFPIDNLCDVMQSV
jgi:hypothetical protein